jgi:hypothetical protein
VSGDVPGAPLRIAPRTLPDTPSMPWDEIAQRRRRAPGMGPFVARIRDSDFAYAIHGLSTVGGVLIAPSPAIPWRGPFLRVDSRMGGMRFEYVDGGAVQTSWRTSHDEAFESLERFVRRQRWIVEYREAAPET